MSPLLTRWLMVLVVVLFVAGCATSPTPSAATPSLQEGASAPPRSSAASSAGPELPLSLEVPSANRALPIRVTVTPDLPADGSGSVVVRLTNLSDETIAEAVLRWPTELANTIWLAPFKPTRARIEGTFTPLYVEWTKWVVGPGESGEPGGTTSLGWGPLLPGATIVVPLVATRRGAGPVSFDFQVLWGEAILQFEGGEPSELRLELP